MLFYSNLYWRMGYTTYSGPFLETPLQASIVPDKLSMSSSGLLFSPSCQFLGALMF